MKEPNQGKPPKRPKAKELTENALVDRLAECVHSTMKKEIEKDVEPFEAYGSQLRVRFYGRGKHFREKFVQGYEVLLEALQGMPHQ